MNLFCDLFGLFGLMNLTLGWEIFWPGFFNQVLSSTRL
jgi:hypothetical protein